MFSRGRFHKTPLLRGALVVGALGLLGFALFLGIWSGGKKRLATHVKRPTRNVLSGSIRLDSKTWHCRGPVDLRSVRLSCTERVTMQSTSTRDAQEPSTASKSSATEGRWVPEETG